MGLMNRLSNCHNSYQGDYHRVLTVCSAGLLRSATMAYVLAREPYNCNVRNVGVSEDYALIPIDEVHVEWAQSIICAEQEQLRFIEKLAKEKHIDLKRKKVYCLDLPDNFGYRDKKLVKLIVEKLQAIGFPMEKNDAD
jgi:predicted protein tyrosine phosphatase